MESLRKGDLLHFISNYHALALATRAHLVTATREKGKKGQP